MDRQMKYKDYPKYDARRLLVVLFALERLERNATLHYIAQEIDCTRAEVQRAIETAQKTFLVDIEKEGSVYKLTSWGILDKNAALASIKNHNDPEKI